ncbi:MAG: phosphate transport system substrate-binding protein [Sphingomonadales bacterium]|jgi:phosphate transport system substrate-binding protein|nr:phosphate transport system substrate-binding protein [Sphingomonadales bacterium]
MKRSRRSFFALLAAVFALAACEQAPRRQIRIVGSSTVYPFTTAVAERFAQNRPSFHAPIVESTGTGAGMQLFCGGVGARFPDIENASRRIKASELERCRANGVNHIIEVPIGIDGLALIESATRPTGFSLSVRDVYAALAAEPFGRPQTARTWRDVNPALPNVPIMVYGPPPTSGTRDSFVELMLTKGCETDPAMKALKESDSQRHTRLCTRIREDGAFVEAGENDNLLIQRVSQNQGTIGVLGYSFMEENLDRVRGVPIGGVAPTAETIRGFTYPGARRLYIYVKGEHLDAVPGLREFLAEYARGWGPGAYLTDRGLIPLPDAMRESAAAIARTLPAMNAAGLH